MQIYLKEVTPNAKVRICKWAQQNHFDYEISAADSYLHTGIILYDIILKTKKDIVMVSCTDSRWGIYNSSGEDYITFPKNDCLSMIVRPEV